MPGTYWTKPSFLPRKKSRTVSKRTKFLQSQLRNSVARSLFPLRKLTRRTRASTAMPVNRPARMLGMERRKTLHNLRVQKNKNKETKRLLNETKKANRKATKNMEKNLGNLADLFGKSSI